MYHFIKNQRFVKIASIPEIILGNKFQRCDITFYAFIKSQYEYEYIFQIITIFRMIQGNY